MGQRIDYLDYFALMLPYRHYYHLTAFFTFRYLNTLSVLFFCICLNTRRKQGKKGFVLNQDICVTKRGKLIHSDIAVATLYRYTPYSMCDMTIIMSSEIQPTLSYPHLYATPDLYISLKSISPFVSLCISSASMSH